MRNVDCTAAPLMRSYAGGHAGFTTKLTSEYNDVAYHNAARASEVLQVLVVLQASLLHQPRVHVVAGNALHSPSYGAIHQTE